MKSKRRRHDPESKARVALEVLKGIKTIQQIAKEFDIHPVQVSDWKKTMAQGAASVFSSAAGGMKSESFERDLNFAIPGEPLHNHRIAADIQVPLWQDRNGIGLGTDCTLSLGWQYAF